MEEFERDEVDQVLAKLERGIAELAAGMTQLIAMIGRHKPPPAGVGQDAPDPEPQPERRRREHFGFFSR